MGLMSSGDEFCRRADAVLDVSGDFTKAMDDILAWGEEDYQTYI